MARIAVVDPLLTSGQHGLRGDEFGEGHQIVIPRSWSRPDVLDAVADADVLLTAIRPVDEQLLSSAPRLRLVAKPGAGLDNVDVAAATRGGVTVCNAPGARGQAVAEHVLWAILTLAKNLPPRADGLPLDLAGRTVGLVGLGDIGRRVAVSVAAMDMAVVAATPSRTNRAAGVDVRFVDLDRIHRDCDVLVLCAPLVEATRGLLDRVSLRQMHPDALLVNVARGPLVVSDDLAEVMADGHLHGAALDVTDPEPLPPDHPLLSLPNVVLTAHRAGRTARAQQVALAVLVRNVTAHLAGDLPPDAVNAAEVARTRR